MSTNSDRRAKKGAGALVPVSSPFVANSGVQTQRADAYYQDHAIGGAALPFARTPFLAQLSCQYETKTQGRKRRAQTRASAIEHYGKSRNSQALRHLVWA